MDFEKELREFYAKPERKKKKSKTNTRMSRGRFYDYKNPETIQRRVISIKRTKCMGFGRSADVDRYFESFFTGRLERVRRNCYPAIGTIGGQPRLVMRAAIPIKPITDDKEEFAIRNSLVRTLEDVEIELDPVMADTGEMVNRTVTGYDIVDYVMEATASSYPMFAKILELKSFVKNPIFQDNYPQFYNAATGSYRDPTLEELCKALKIKNQEFLATFFVAVRNYSQQRIKAYIDLSMPAVIKATVRNAKEAKGTRDRKLMFQAADLIGTGGVSVNVTQNNANVGGSAGVAQGLPKWEDATQKAIAASSVSGGEEIRDEIAVEGELVTD